MAFMERARPRTKEILLSSQKSAIHYYANIHSAAIPLCSIVAGHRDRSTGLDLKMISHKKWQG